MAEAISIPERRKRNETRHVLLGVTGKMAKDDVKIANLSLGGVGLETAQSLRVGKKYPITLSGHGETLELTGVVRWCRIAASKFLGAGAQPSYAVGMAFEDVGPEQLQRLYAFIGAELSHTVT